MWLWPSNALLNLDAWKWRSCVSLKGVAGLEKWPWMVAEAHLAGGNKEAQPQDCMKQGREEQLLPIAGRLQ